jgi:sugar lactone lactonase YvrE
MTGGKNLLIGKRFKWLYPLVMVATLALGLPVLAGTAAASSLPAPYISPPGGNYDLPMNVNITDAINDPIYYTTDGSDPETNNNASLYSGVFTPAGGFTVSQSETVSAAAYDQAAGWSSVTSDAFTIYTSSTVPAPTLSPDGGSFAAAQTVTITGIPAGDTCYCTTDGSDPSPTESSSAVPYTAPFTVSQSEKIEAANYSPSNGYSGVTVAMFNIAGSVLVPAPTITPGGGSFATAQFVTIGNIPVTPDEDTCYYTTDGSDPETSSTAQFYGRQAFQVGTGTVKAANYDFKYGWSSVTSATFNVSTPPPPVPSISPDGGSFTGAQTVTIGNIPSGDICYYNTDSNCSPADDRILYSGPFTLSQSETVNAANWNQTGGWSAVTMDTFVISNSSSSSSLTITPNGGNFATAQTVTITGAPSGDTCSYTTDGSNPVSSSTAVLYTGAFTVSQSGTVQAAFHDPANGWSSVTSAEFNISSSLSSQALVINPDGGTFNTPQTVTITGIPVGDEVYYTVDGSNPTSSGTNTYLGAFTVSQSGTVQAAIRDPIAGWGTVTSATFTINTSPATVSIPVFSTLSPGEITTVAGDGTGGYSGDGSAATSADLDSPSGVAVDASGNIYIADQQNNRIRKVDTSGTITTVAGNGTAGYSGDGGPATSAELDSPSGVAVDSSGNLYIADSLNSVIRKVSPSGAITTVAGNGYNRLGTGQPGFNDGGYSGDGGPATSAELNNPYAVAVDASGNIYIADTYNRRIRKVDASGTITTVAGNGYEGSGDLGGYSGDGEPATSAELAQPFGVAVDNTGNIYIDDQNNNRIRRVDASGVITTVVGGGISSGVSSPAGVAVDAAGNLYIADMGNQCIRKVDATGALTTVAGSIGNPGYSGDGGSATAAELNFPFGVAVDASGNIIIADRDNSRIREVKASSSIATSPGVNASTPTATPTTSQNPIGFIIGRPDYTVGGRSLIMDAAPFIANERALVPMRYLADALGAQTTWDAATQKVTITKGGTTVELTIGSTSIITNGQSSQMEVAPVIVDGRTYLPARYVAEAFGCNVSWNAAVQTVTVSQ